MTEHRATQVDITMSQKSVLLFFTGQVCFISFLTNILDKSGIFKFETRPPNKCIQVLVIFRLRDSNITSFSDRHILHAKLHIVTRLSYNILLITAAYLCIPLITLVYL